MPAANDHLSAAVAITNSTGSLTLDFTGATYQEPGSPDPTEGEEWWWGEAYPTLWFRWTATADGPVTFRLGSGAPYYWDLVIAPDASDWQTFIDSPDAVWGATIDAVNGTTYLVYVVDEGADHGDAPATAAVLSWAPYIAPPVAGSWFTTPAHNTTGGVAPGDTIYLFGSNLSGVTSVTVGGHAQAFTIISDTQITITADDTAASGPIVVDNGGVPDAATGDAVRLYRSGWWTPSTTLTPSNYWGTGSGFIPDADAKLWTGYTWDAATEGPPDFVTTSSDDDGSVEHHVAPEVPFGFKEAVQHLSLRAAWDSSYSPNPGEMPEAGGPSGRPFVPDPADPNVDMTGAYPDGWDLEFEATGPDAGTLTPDGDVVVYLKPRATRAGALPSRDIALYILADGDSPPGTVFTFRTRTALSGATPAYQGPTGESVGTITVPVPRPATDDGTVEVLIVPADLLEASSPFASTDDFSETLISLSEVAVEYQPPRYRYLSPIPPALTVHTLRRRQQAARTGSAPRRRQIGNRASSPRRGPGAAP